MNSEIKAQQQFKKEPKLIVRLFWAEGYLSVVHGHNKKKVAVCFKKSSFVSILPTKAVFQHFSKLALLNSGPLVTFISPMNTDAEASRSSIQIQHVTHCQRSSVSPRVAKAKAFNLCSVKIT